MGLDSPAPFGDYDHAMNQTYYVTTPIYYVNDVPHIGHSYTTIAADVLARYHRTAGRDVWFLTGTDEHGIKIVKAAREKGLTPPELADQVVVHFQDLWRDLNVTNDDFIRTSQPRHENRVRRLVARLIEADEIHLGKYEGWYDEGQEEFVAASAARDNEFKSAVSGEPLVRYSEPSYFFRLTKWVPKLIEHIESNPGFIRPQARRNEVLSKLRQSSEDLSISRPQAKLMHWGIPMPNDESHSVYVWIDALSNYYTALGMPEIGDEYDGRHAGHWPADVHLIGKDILWFHAVYWPCMLMALDIPLPKCIFAHGWWTSEGRKMSKSLGNFISRETIAEICREYSRDVYRYYLLRAVAFGSDGDFSREELKMRYNADLANGVGNLLSRTVNMICRYRGGAVPPAGRPPSEAAPVIAAAEDICDSAEELMNDCAFHTYIEKTLAVVSETNRFIDVTEPFRLAKTEPDSDRLSAILYTAAEAVRIVLLLLGPILPETVDRGFAQLGWRPDKAPLGELARWGVLPAGVAVEKRESLFPRKT